MNPWRVVSILLIPISYPVAFLFFCLNGLFKAQEAWDLREARRAIEDRYSRPEMRMAWTCGCGHLNQVGPVMLPNGDRVPATMCGNCGGDRL